MGLGKTLQAISLLSYLKVHEMSPGPFCKSRILCSKNHGVFIVGISLELGNICFLAFLFTFNYLQSYCVL